MDQKLNKLLLPSLVMLSLFAASIEPLLVKVGFQKGYSLLSMIFFRNIIACITAIFFIKNRSWLGWQSILKIIPLALLLFIVNVASLFALQFINVASVLIIVATTPIFVALVNQRLGRDVLQKTFWLGIIISFIGVYLSVGVFQGLSSFHVLSFLALLLAIACSTTYRVYMESVTKIIEPAQISFYIFSINALLSMIFLPFFIRTISWQSLSIATWIGVAAALANIAFISAIHYLGATRMSVIDMLQRPLVIIAAVFLLNETLSNLQIAGCILTFIGTQLARVKRVSKEKSIKGQ
jgi:drug/metabolite transporter (DMT)-like permease